MESANDLGANLRRERERRGWTQEVVATEAGVSRNFIASVETGRIGNPGVFTLRRVARALDVPLESLLGRPTVKPADRYNLSDGQRELEARLALSGRQPFEPWTREEYALYMPFADHDEIMAAAELATAHHFDASTEQEPRWAALAFYASGALAMALVVDNSRDN